jgi:hypothetical protein
MAYNIAGISQVGVSKNGGDIKYHSADALATVEGAGYFNSLAVDNAIPAVGLLTHVDTNLKKVTIYGYSHNGTTVTLSTGNKEVML